FRYSFTNQSSEQDCFDLAKGHHTLFYLQASASLLAGVFFALRIPERFYPGRFDIFGSSHQIFHVLIAIALYFQNKLIEEVTEEAKYKINAGEISHEILGTHWMYTIGLFVLVTGVVHSIVVLFYWKIDPCSNTAGNAEKQD
uniref:Uncharacterized protein n=1 Tax=Ciona savignyi TaxID=51511 RepID=H2YY16_CIOSA